MQPIPKERHRQDQSHKTNKRIYHELPKGVWIDVLVDRISQHRIKNPCTWAFKRAKVHPDGEKYIIIHAKCTTGNAYKHINIFIW